MFKTQTSLGILNECHPYDQALIRLLLPHRPPFLMVDSIVAFRGGRNPYLLANYAVKENEPLYLHREAGVHWPSMYVIEGLGQACNLMIVISALENKLMGTGLETIEMDEVLDQLINDRSDETTATLKGLLQRRLAETYSNVGFLGSADLEITGHVRQGEVVSYEVQQNQAFGTLYHSSVRAFTDSHLIARGKMVSASRTG